MTKQSWHSRENCPWEATIHSHWRHPENNEPNSDKFGFGKGKTENKKTEKPIFKKKDRFSF